MGHLQIPGHASFRGEARHRSIRSRVEPSNPFYYDHGKKINYKMHLFNLNLVFTLQFWSGKQTKKTSFGRCDFNIYLVFSLWKFVLKFDRLIDMLILTLGSR